MPKKKKKAVKKPLTQVLGVGKKTKKKVKSVTKKQNKKTSKVKKVKKGKLLEKIIAGTLWKTMTLAQRAAEEQPTHRIVVNPSLDPNFYVTQPHFATGTIAQDVALACATPPVIKKVTRPNNITDTAWNKILNTVPLQANAEYVIGTYTYRTDNVGRICHVEGFLQLTDDPESFRNAYQQGKSVELKDGVKKNDGLYKNSDDGGHIIGAQFKGPWQQINYFPQHMAPNEYAQWYALEKKWAENLTNPPGHQVHVTIALSYPDATTKRPNKVNVVTKIIDKNGTAVGTLQSRVDNPMPIRKID